EAYWWRVCWKKRRKLAFRVSISSLGIAANETMAISKNAGGSGYDNRDASSGAMPRNDGRRDYGSTHRGRLRRDPRQTYNRSAQSLHCRREVRPDARWAQMGRGDSG